jgi:polar amino acid transport system permease protein
MEIDWKLVASILPPMLLGFAVTVKATVVSFLLALVGGLVLLLGRRSGFKVLRTGSYAVVEFVRSTPLLVQMFFLYFIGPEVGITLSPLATGIVAMALHYSCYMVEIYRAGVEAVPDGQWNAALALNFSPADTFFRIVLPQSLVPIIPNAGSVLIFMLKDSPFLAAISVAEMMNVAWKVGAENFQYLEPMTLCGLVFLAMSLVLAKGVSTLEKRIKWMVLNR